MAFHTQMNEGGTRTNGMAAYGLAARGGCGSAGAAPSANVQEVSSVHAFGELLFEFLQRRWKTIGKFSRCLICGSSAINPDDGSNPASGFGRRCGLAIRTIASKRKAN